MKQLVIAEKPSVARDIARVLNCKKKPDTFLEGEKYIVTWSLGHLVTLADPEEYGTQYKNMGYRYFTYTAKRLETDRHKTDIPAISCCKEQLYRKDVNSIIIATDAGREGELVARWILEKPAAKSQYSGSGFLLSLIKRSGMDLHT